jgi:type III restriction enzyme
MQLKEYQQRALAEIRSYLDQLTLWEKKAEQNPDLEIDFPVKAWEKAGIRHFYLPRKNGLGQPLPAFCLKIPTGGGKTLLAVKTIDLVNMVYRKRKTGLVLWIVPTTQIYRQTIQSLKDRNHPYRQHLDLATGGHTQIFEKTDHFSPQDIQENLVVLMLMLPSANRKTKETLKVFKDNGGFQNFFPPEDDIKAQETLRGFNPCLIAELSATPVQSNVLVNITGQELLREEMIKLDLHVTNKASPDWKDTLLDSVNKRNILETSWKRRQGNMKPTPVFISGPFV